MSDELEQKVVQEVARELGLPRDAYGQPDYTQARELLAWWVRCQRIRDNTIGGLLAALGVAGWAFWSSVQPFMSEAIRRWLLSWLAS